MNKEFTNNPDWCYMFQMRNVDNDDVPCDNGTAARSPVACAALVRRARAWEKDCFGDGVAMTIYIVFNLLDSSL